MPKSMTQPNLESSKDYFREYCLDQVKKIKLEMTRLDKRLKKVHIAQELYQERFGEILTLEEK